MDGWEDLFAKESQVLGSVERSVPNEEGTKYGAAACGAIIEK